MVVGTGAYKDRSEAYPLDKKTLRAIALRSFFIDASFNSETGQSIGWLWAMMPGLKKIHTNEEDLSLSMGHNLEYVNTGTFLTTLTMGAVLSLEQQKADLEAIRSARSVISAGSLGTGFVLFRCLLIPCISLFAALLGLEGNMLAAVICFLVPAAISVILRLVLINVGYSMGTRAFEPLIRHRAELTHAARIAGIFMIGAMAAVFAADAAPAFRVVTGEYVFDMNGTMASVMPGLLGVACVWTCYSMLVKKEKSLFVCVITVIAAGMLCGLCGIF